MDRQFHVLRGASYRDIASSLVVAAVLIRINGKMKRWRGFGTIIAKTRGACVIARVNLWAESKMGLKQKIKKACKSAPAWAFGPHGPCILDLV